MALPDKHQLKFNTHKDAKSLMEAIEKRFGGNKETKKVQKNLLKQQYGNFTGSSSESLDQIHDRLQNLISQLEILRESLSQEDINLKFLRSLPTYLKIYEAEVKSSSSTSPTTQNIAFVSSQNTNSTSESVSAVASVSAASIKVPISALPNVDTLSDAMAMLTIKAMRFLQRIGRNLGANGTTFIGFDMSKVECYNCHKRGHFAKEFKSPKDTRNKETHIRNVLVETSTFNALVSQCDGVGSYDWSFHAEEEPTNYAIVAFTSSSSSSSDNEVASCSKACTKACTTLQSHYDKLTNNLRKSQFDVISYKTGLQFVEARILVYQQNETIYEEDIKLIKLDVMLRDNALVDLRKKFKKAEQEKDELKLKLDKFQTSSNNLSQLLASQTFNKTGLGYDNQVFKSTVFDYDEMFSSKSDVSMPTSPVYDSPTKPDMDLSQSNKSSTPMIKDWVFDSENKSEGEPMTTQKAPSFVPTSKHVKTPRPSVKPVNPQHVLKDKGVIDSGCSWHMTGNISYLSDFEEINGRYIAFGGNIKGGKITSKGKIKTDTECIVLSSDFKLLDDNHVLLRVPRENNMYNVDLKNIVPSGDLTCLFTKATLDEASNIEPLAKPSLSVLSALLEEPIVTYKGNQPNSSAGIQEHFDADKAGEGNVQQYVLFPLWSTGSKDPQNTNANAIFEVKEPESKVHVSPRSSAKTKKHDDKTKRKTKGKSHVELSTGVRNLSEEFEYFSNNSINRCKLLDHDW
uniref:Retrovirus-related Pol polyprotein from transposon TNT 1-94-like beta-barrel domain-containing protein n=1 Tax=Tanacetum cinerariifolium TaxID=118510 RepID=A0A6L2L3J1_TANCI|nr:hypothetical protein [Tanacetum cinerariifolium]